MRRPQFQRNVLLVQELQHLRLQMRQRVVVHDVLICRPAYAGGVFALGILRTETRRSASAAVQTE